MFMLLKLLVFKDNKLKIKILFGEIVFDRVVWVMCRNYWENWMIDDLFLV